MNLALISMLGLVRSITPHMNESVVRSYRTDRLEFFFVRELPLTLQRANDLFMGGVCWGNEISWWNLICADYKTVFKSWEWCLLKTNMHVSASS
jgi:hypothetical protein